MPTPLKPSHIYWFCYFDLHEPSVRYRAAYAMQVMKEVYDVPSTLVMPGYSLRTMLRFLVIYMRVLVVRRQHSVIVFQKLHTNRLYVRALKILLRLRPRATLYDTDDADYLRFPSKTIHHFGAHCSVCTVGSTALQQYFSRLNLRVEVLTSPVVTHRQQKRTRSDVFTIGWIGYWNDHRDSLRQLVFPGLCQLPFPFKLILIGMPDLHTVAEVREYFERCPHITVECPLDTDWLDEDSIYCSIKAFDAGLAPLLNTEMNRAKSAFKAKQYLSCGVPVLGTAVGENAAFLHHGINGFVCDSPGEYAAYITELATMPDKKYTALSLAARNSTDNFSMDRYCKEFLRIASSVL